MTDKEVTFRSGYVAIIGRPNVGKSTLINRALGQKLCITSRRPQTTRHRILGIKTSEDSQLIYVDTPGMHDDGKRAMNRYLNRAAASSIDDVDVVLFVVEGLKWTDEDELVLKRLK
jgi:GTP-binding protein Era